MFLRPGELRQAEWAEIDLDAGVWTIAASKMMMRVPQKLPLSRQAIELLIAARVLAGQHRYVFASLYSGTRPISENTINAALRRMGYAGDELTAQGLSRHGMHASG